MRLLYTEMDQDLTRLLTEEAMAFSKAGKRVFYIAPNSLSFEKERQVLAYLPQQASFDVIVTRFGQMVRYFALTTVDHRKPLDDVGLTMLFYRALTGLPEGSLKLYSRLRQNGDFITQLVALYKELQQSGISIDELEGLDSSEKQDDLKQIFAAFYELLEQGDYQQESKVNFLSRQIASGQLNEALAQVAIVVDGFTRFSLEETNLIQSLAGAGVPVVIGTYASQSAYRSPYISGNLYEAGVVFLRELSQMYGVSAEYQSLDNSSNSAEVVELSKHFQARYDFSVIDEGLSPQAKEAVSIWEVVSQKEEVTQVAKRIRHYLDKGYRYKDITLLLGDVDSYRLHIGKLFDQYEIPYYFAKSESMSQHPLVNVLDSLWRIKRYRYQAEDVLNLFKTGLYGDIGQLDLDHLEQYIYYAQIKGVQKFKRPFTLNNKGKYHLEILNQQKDSLITPLMAFLQGKPQTGHLFLAQLKTFLEAIALPSHLSAFSLDGDQQTLEETEQVWQVFCHVLEQFEDIFGNQVLTVEEGLSLIRSGMMSADYRTVPARVDVVTVKAYDLITPHANKLVFAIGMTQGNFPKVSQNTSLLSDDERLRLHSLAGKQVLDIPSQEQGKRNHLTALSLLHAATEHLVLSYPQLYKETEETISPYLSQLEAIGISKQTKGGASFSDSAADIGHYKGLLSQIIELNRQELPEELSPEQKTFWTVAVRYLRKKLETEQLTFPSITTSIDTKALEADTLSVLFPAGVPLRLSASALTDFYNSQYKYFLKHILRLQELETILPDARIHGNFLHKVFEEILRDQSDRAFDDKICFALEKTVHLEAFHHVYGESSQTAFAQLLLEDIVKATAKALRDDSLVETIREEAGFKNQLLVTSERQLELVGKIDRIDQVKDTQAIGVIDYKSSAQTFQISRFFNGLSPQLMTYLLAVASTEGAAAPANVFGAMYLHMADPIIQLNKLKSLADLPKASLDSLQFKGLFVEETSQMLTPQYGKTAANTYTKEELAILLAYTERLYRRAAERILQGKFDINPYTEDGRSVTGDQYSSITHFEADLHLTKARHLAKFGRKKEEWLDQMKETLD